jgi:arylsulfatase A-like enzyme
MVGRLLDGLEKSPHRDNTVIVFWGDHGWHLGEKEHWRKFALWEEATRAPMIWVAPGVTKPGGTCNRTVDFMSIYPTLCDLAGIATPEHAKKPSLRPLLADPQAKWDYPGITTFHRNNHGIRTEGFRYIRYADGGEELYDESADPYEWTNLANDSKYAMQKAELAKLLPQENVDELPRNDGDAAKAKKQKKGKGGAGNSGSKKKRDKANS